MGLQLILCMETNERVKSDYIYINNTIKFFYELDQSNIRISPVYMCGKGNYNSSGVRKKISKFFSMYDGAAKNNRSKVIYCFDCDNYDKKSEDAIFLDKVKKYCEENDYEFVWFCKDIEQVYLGHSVSDSDKKKEAMAFDVKKKIREVDIGKLRVNRYLLHKSNLCCVLDKYLTFKK